LLRWSQAFIPTLRDDPAEAEAPSHKLLVRAGFIRQLMAGSYSLLPPAIRVRAKIMSIIRQEIDAIGGQEFLLPALHPADLWRRSGRWDVMGSEMFRLVDRKDAELCLGMTHEEVFTTLALELKSYRQLPQLWYQIQTKFRDEPRPKSGVLRVREFTMKDSYSFDLEAEGLDLQFGRHAGAYRRIFERCGLDVVSVAASSGAMGGSGSMEFMVRSEAGEDVVVICSSCGYAANVEAATSVIAPVVDDHEAGLESFPTPGVRTIKALADFDGGAPANRQIKTLVYLLDGTLTLVLLRGDHELVEQKLLDVTGAIEARPAQPDEIQAALGAQPGSLGAVGVTGIQVVADRALQGRVAMTTGANKDDVHYRNVSVGRDIEVGTWSDLRLVREGEGCPECGSPVEVTAAIEVGHIFKLGTKYSDPLGAHVLDADGNTRPIHMGSYGIGVERTLAAIIEASHDDKGIVWPMSVAPYEVVITVIRPDDETTLEAAVGLAAALELLGVDVMLDDRPERPGVKFADAELVGFPIRVTVGPRGLESGVVEVVNRATGATREVALEEAAGTVADVVGSARNT